MKTLTQFVIVGFDRLQHKVTTETILAVDIHDANRQCRELAKQRAPHWTPSRVGKMA